MQPEYSSHVLVRWTALALCPFAAALAGCTNSPGEPSAAGALAAEAPPPPAVPTTPAPSAGSKADPPPAAAIPDGMLEIPAGLFLMGSPFSSGTPEEHPMHEVAIAAFYMDRTEVTAAAYAACERAGACPPAHDTLPLCTAHKPGREDHPINCVEFAQAEAYCRFAGKRLPSEREWEYAARGGSELRKYSWGEEPPDRQRACYDHIGTCPVGSFAPGAFGLLDMSGGVWEWTSTWFGPYPGEAESGTHRVYRGGSFSRRFPKWLRTALRNRFRPEEWSAALGIRCVRSVSPPRCPDDTAPRDLGPDRGTICERVRGTPACEPSFAWNGTECSLAGAPAGAAAAALAAVPTAPRGEGPAAPALADASPPVNPADTPVVRARSPEFDADCQSHYKGHPAAYRYSGGTFHARNPVIASGGCTKRDTGDGWTSACCPGG